MTHQNLILTEKAIKNHSKRLQKELKTLNQDLSLGETQNLFSKTLGFNNFHELKKVLDKDIYETKNLLLENLIKISKNQQEINQYFLKLCENGNLELIKNLFNDDIFIKKPELNIKDRHGNESGALHQACLSGNLELVKYLIEDKNILFNNNPFIFFYCRHVSIFKYMINYLNINQQNDDFIKNLKSILINHCFYDYDSFIAILSIKNLNMTVQDYTMLLYNLIKPYTYDNDNEINSKHKIIKHLISLGANLYDDNQDIFVRLMELLTSYENKGSDEYFKNKIRCILSILNHLDNNYNYLAKYGIKNIIFYLKNNPDLLTTNYNYLMNSYIKNLLKSS